MWYALIENIVLYLVYNLWLEVCLHWTLNTRKVSAVVHFSFVWDTSSQTEETGRAGTYCSKGENPGIKNYWSCHHSVLENTFFFILLFKQQHKTHAGQWKIFYYFVSSATIYWFSKYFFGKLLGQKDVSAFHTYLMLDIMLINQA